MLLCLQAIESYSCYGYTFITAIVSRAFVSVAVVACCCIEWLVGGAPK